MMVRAQLAWNCLSLTGRGSDFTPEPLAVVWAEERRCTGPARDSRLIALFSGNLAPAAPSFESSLP